MAETSMKEFFQKKIESARDLYIKDLESMSQEDLGKSAGGAARTPFDFTFETVFVNKRISTRMRGETPEAMSGDDGWMTAPTEFCDKAKAVAQFKDSMDEILTSWSKVDEAKLLEPIALPSGETSLANLALFACVHNSYHDAQLNLIQAINGDDKIHWE